MCIRDRVDRGIDPGDRGPFGALVVGSWPPAADNPFQDDGTVHEREYLRRRAVRRQDAFLHVAQLEVVDDVDRLVVDVEQLAVEQAEPGVDQVAARTPRRRKMCIRDRP